MNKIKVLHCADLHSAKNIPFIPYACPDTGSFIGYKKAGKFIIELKILSDARRCSATERECRCDKAEVLSAAVIGSNDELLCPVEVTPGYFGQQLQEAPQTSRRAVQCQKVACANLEVAQQGFFPGCSGHFDPKLYQYGKLREKMAIEILVKAVRVSHINVEENDVETLDC